MSQQPLGLVLSFYRRHLGNNQRQIQHVPTAAWACIEFLPSHECAEAFGGLIWVSTAAWACIEFLHDCRMRSRPEALERLNSRLGLH